MLYDLVTTSHVFSKYFSDMGSLIPLGYAGRPRNPIPAQQCERLSSLQCIIPLSIYDVIFAEFPLPLQSDKLLRALAARHSQLFLIYYSVHVLYDYTFTLRVIYKRLSKPT